MNKLFVGMVLLFALNISHAQQMDTNNGWDAYASRVSGLRTIEGTAMLQHVKSWASQ